MTTPVQVAVRVRPLTAKELLDNCRECVSCLPDGRTVCAGGDKYFAFDSVFAPTATQLQVYTDSVVPLIAKFMQGFNATILAYGQTGSGKTFSMGTGLEVMGDNEQQGIVPRAIHDVFAQLAAKKEADAEHYDYSVSVSFLELYNEDLIDLLNPAAREKKEKGNLSVTIRDDGHGGILWTGIREEPVKTPEELLALLQKGSLCRTTGSTDMNMTSSRSHAIFSITLRQHTVEPGGSVPSLPPDVDTTAPQQKPSTPLDATVSPITATATDLPARREKKLLSKFHFVDLAGSERLKRTNAVGDRAKEGISINQGLLALGNVISALGEENRKTSFVPYRDSKLTRLLQDSLGGNSQTLMLACISSGDINFQESVNTLRYADRAKNIKNKAMINQDWSGLLSTLDKDRELRILRATIQQLRTELAARGGGGSKMDFTSPGNADSFMSDRDKLEREIEGLRSENSKSVFELERLQHAFSTSQARLKDLNDQVVKVTAERDTLAIEFSKLRDAAGGNADALPIDATTLDSHPIVLEYVQNIASLKYRLSESEDRLAWYTEMMNKVASDRAAGKDCKAGKKRAVYRRDLAESVDSARREIMMDRRMSRSEDDDIPGDLRSQFSQGRSSGSASVADGRFFETASEDNNNDEEERASASGDGHGERKENQDDMFRILHKLQTDISMKEELVQQLERTQEEYTVMRDKYENKMNLLHDNLMAVQRERDLALNRKQPQNQEDTKKIEIVRTRYEDKVKKLMQEMTDLKRKAGEANKTLNSTRAQNEGLIKGMKESIETLKAEKTRLVRQLKQESDRMKEVAASKERQIRTLQYKEKAAAEKARKLERNNQLQRIMLKKRTDEVIQSHSKLKSVMSLLKKTNTPKSISKANLHAGAKRGKARGAGSAASNSGAAAAAAGPRITSAFGSKISLSMLSLSNTSLADAPSSGYTPHMEDVRTSFKKSMVDKEIAACVSGLQAKRVYVELLQKKRRLLGEQAELLAERQRIVDQAAEETGVYDPASPQYMDDRLELISAELHVVERRVDTALAELTSLGHTSFENLSADSGAKVDIDVTQDYGYENAVNLLKSLDALEIEKIAEIFLHDIVELRVADKIKSVNICALEKANMDLQRTVQMMKKTAIDTAIEFERRMLAQGDNSQEFAEIKHSLSETIHDGGYEQQQQDDHEQRSNKMTDQRAVSPTLDPLAARVFHKPSLEQALRELKENMSAASSRPTSSDANATGGLPGNNEMDTRAPLADFSSSFQHSPSKWVMTREKELGDDFAGLILRRKKPPAYPVPPPAVPDPKTLSRDVFQRLASSHTLSSQAKMIQKNALGITVVGASTSSLDAQQPLPPPPTHEP